MAKPVKSYQVGRVQAAVWKNEYKGEISYSFSFQVNYYSKKEEKYVSKSFFRPSDLPSLIGVVTTLMVKGMTASKSSKSESTQKQAPQQTQRQEPAPQQSQPQENHEEDLY